MVGDRGNSTDSGNGGHRSGAGATSKEDTADAFALVGNEHRVAILRALLDAHADAETPYPTPFARLRERAGVEVSAQFAYHLDELVGSFVARTADGYRLRYAGWKAAAALAAGTYTQQPAFGPTPIDGDCPHCGPTPETGGGGLHASYGDAWLTVACHDCDRVLTRYPFPPGGAADRLDDPDSRSDTTPDATDIDEIAALLDAFDRRVRSHFSLAVDGVCPECAGPMHTGLESVDADGVNDTRGDGHSLQVVADCERCGNHLTLPVGCVILDDPAVTAWCATHGMELDNRQFWELSVVAPDAVTKTGTDPLEATVTVEGADVVVTVTERLDVSLEEPTSSGSPGEN